VSIAGSARLAVTVVAEPGNWAVRGRWLPSGQLVPWPDGLFYCPITFDGGAVFQPEIALEFDAATETCDHQTMDQRLMAGAPSGDSCPGRHLFARLRATGVEVCAAGSSDWVVFADPNGYAADEAYFPHCIIHTVHAALAGHPGLDAAKLLAHCVNLKLYSPRPLVRRSPPTSSNACPALVQGVPHHTPRWEPLRRGGASCPPDGWPCRTP
jgi:hypothetical protein